MEVFFLLLRKDIQLTSDLRERHVFFQSGLSEWMKWGGEQSTDNQKVN
jgi:hypothetical protein